MDVNTVTKLIAMQDDDEDLEATRTERLIEALDACYLSEEARDN
jgi:hypothetical protein